MYSGFFVVAPRPASSLSLFMSGLPFSDFQQTFCPTFKAPTQYYVSISIYMRRANSLVKILHAKKSYRPCYLLLRVLSSRPRKSLSAPSLAKKELFLSQCDIFVTL